MNMSADENSIVEWNDRLSVSIPIIDEQHKSLVDMTNDLYVGCLQGDEAAVLYFKTAVRKAVDYVKYHFATEERILENINYPRIAEHKKQHEDFVKEILHGVKEFEEGKKFVPNVFVRYLRDWILTHIAVADKNYAEYIINLKKKGHVFAPHAMTPSDGMPPRP
jgi:hemerythrin